MPNSVHPDYHDKWQGSCAVVGIYHTSNSPGEITVYSTHTFNLYNNTTKKQTFNCEYSHKRFAAGTEKRTLRHKRTTSPNVQ